MQSAKKAPPTSSLLKNPHAARDGVKNGLTMLMCCRTHSAYSTVFALSRTRLRLFQPTLPACKDSIIARTMSAWLVVHRYNASLEKVRVGQTTAGVLLDAGGKSGLHRAGRQVTPGGCESMESATENIPPKRNWSMAWGAGKGEKVW